MNLKEKLFSAGDTKTRDALRCAGHVYMCNFLAFVYILFLISCLCHAQKSNEDGDENKTLKRLPNQIFISRSGLGDSDFVKSEKTKIALGLPATTRRFVNFSLRRRKENEKKTAGL